MSLLSGSDEPMYGDLHGCATRCIDSSKSNLANITKDEYDHLADALNKLSRLCRQRAERWYHDINTGERIFLNNGERFALMHSEITEAFEGVRKGLMDKHLPHRPALDVELADLLIRVFDYAGENGVDLGGALVEKLEYNRTREDHTYAARREPNGKKF